MKTILSATDREQLQSVTVSEAIANPSAVRGSKERLSHDAYSSVYMFGW